MSTTRVLFRAAPEHVRFAAETRTAPQRGQLSNCFLPLPAQKTCCGMDKFPFGTWTDLSDQGGPLAGAVERPEGNGGPGEQVPRKRNRNQGEDSVDPSKVSCWCRALCGRCPNPLGCDEQAALAPTGQPGRRAGRSESEASDPSRYCAPSSTHMCVLRHSQLCFFSGFFSRGRVSVTVGLLCICDGVSGSSSCKKSVCAFPDREN